MQTISSPDLAHRLRPVIARLGRRLRQEAGGELSPSQAAALTTVAAYGPLTPSEAAPRERTHRPPAPPGPAPPPARRPPAAPPAARGRAGSSGRAPPPTAAPASSPRPPRAARCSPPSAT